MRRDGGPATLPGRIEHDHVGPRASQPADGILHAAADEAEAVRRHAVQPGIGLAVAHRLGVLLDGDHRVPAKRERDREQAAAGVQIGHAGRSVGPAGLRENLREQSGRRRRVRLEERRR